MPRHFFIIGGGTLQFDFVKSVNQLGFITDVFDYDPKCVAREIADNFYEISIDEKEKILAIARKLKPVAIQSVATELGNISACYVGEKLNLRTNSYKTALQTTNKWLMKEVCLSHKLPTPKSFLINNPQNISTLSNELSFPFVVKPTDCSAGRGVQLVRNKNEYRQAVNEAFKVSFNKKIFIEEYLDYPQYSIETLTDNGKHYILGIDEEYVNGPPYFVESKHLMPARINEEQSNAINEITYKILEAFKIKYGASHIEIKIKNNKIKILEVASRMGVLRDYLLKLAYGIDYNRVLANIVSGQSYSIVKKQNKFSFAKFMISRSDYTKYLELRKKYPSLIKRVHLFMKPEKDFIAKTLIDSIGFYYIQANSFEDIKSHFEVWYDN